ncbi:MAG: hypothetical protein ACOCQR_02325 [bacterium]
MFLARGEDRSCQIDTYKKGCLPNTGYLIDWDISFSANSKDELLEEIQSYHDVGKKDITVEGGKVCVQTYEISLSDRWVKPSKQEMDKWKKGEQEIYLCDYVYKLFKEV